MNNLGVKYTTDNMLPLNIKQSNEKDPELNDIFANNSLKFQEFEPYMNHTFNDVYNMMKSFVTCSINNRKFLSIEETLNRYGDEEGVYFFIEKTKLTVDYHGRTIKSFKARFLTHDKESRDKFYNDNYVVLVIITNFSVLLEAVYLNREIKNLKFNERKEDANIKSELRKIYEQLKNNKNNSHHFNQGIDFVVTLGTSVINYLYNDNPRLGIAVSVGCFVLLSQML